MFDIKTKGNKIMTFKSELLGTIAIIKLDGKLNIERVADFESGIEKYYNDKVKTIVLDFETVDYIDSSALGSLIKAVNSAKNIDIDLFIYNLSENIYKIFELAYLDKFFSIKSKRELNKEYPHVKF